MMSAPEAGRAREALREKGLAVAPEVLLERAASGDGEACRLLLQAGVEVDARPAATRPGAAPSGVKRTALMEAAEEGHEDVVRLLLEQGADPGLGDFLGTTALHQAARNGHLGVAAALIEHGADVNRAGHQASSPLHDAVLEENVEVAELLLEHGADVHHRNDSGYTALHWAAFRGNAEAVELLLDAGADVDARDRAGKTPLHACAEFAPAPTEAAGILIENGADVGARDASGRTALDLAVEKGSPLAEYLANGRAAPAAAPDALEQVLGRAGWRREESGAHGEGPRYVTQTEHAVWRAWSEEDGRVRLEGRAGDERLELAFQCAATRARLLSVLAEGTGGLALGPARTYVASLLAQGLCTAVEAREGRRWVSLAESVESQARGGRSLVDAVLGAAGWEPEEVTADGHAEPLPARRHRNARATLLVAGADERRLVLLLDRRPPLSIVAVGAAGEWDGRLEDVLRLLIDWQDRLGEPEADAAFWRDLTALSVSALVLRGDRPHSTLDWSRLDARGEPEGGYTLSCGCQKLAGRPSDADAALIRVAGQVGHEGWSEIYCECRRCRRRYRVEEDMGYHYPTYSWDDVTQKGEHRAHFEKE
jgi:hypothetical protein